jgi:threonine dehydrogenase-like Zn-dependent dehydrogenase
MRAARVSEPGRVEIVDLERRRLRDGEVRLAVDAVGVCGSDVALWAGRHPYAVYPVIPGHELGGHVLEAAQGVELTPGQKVTVRPILTCGRCTACREGRFNHCPEVRVLGVHLDGGMAEEIVVPQTTVFPVPEDVPPEAAAIVEPTAVAVHVCHRAGLEAGDSLAILGTVMVGLLCLQVGKAWGAGRVFGVDREPSRLALASELGADRVLDNRRDDPGAAGHELCPEGSMSCSTRSALSHPQECMIWRVRQDDRQ